MGVGGEDVVVVVVAEAGVRYFRVSDVGWIDIS